MHENRTLVRGDNLEEMRKIPDECIDLIATDPPFNSKRNYFVPYRDQHGQEPDTLVKAFTDTWIWGESADETLFLELALRGYDLSRPLRENDETTAEIVKIG